MAVMEQLPHKVVEEYINKLERDGYSKDYIDGTLEGMSFVLEFYQSMIRLSKIKSKMVKEEFNVTT